MGTLIVGVFGTLIVGVFGTLIVGVFGTLIVGVFGTLIVGVMLVLMTVLQSGQTLNQLYQLLPLGPRAKAIDCSSTYNNTLQVLQRTIQPHHSQGHLWL